MHAKRANQAETPIRVVLISLDSHLSGAVDRARALLRKDLPGLSLSFHAAADWARDSHALVRCREDIAAGDIIVASMLFMEDHIEAVRDALAARRESCDAMLGCLSAADIVKLTRIGRFRMDRPESGPIAMLKRLRGKPGSGSSGAGQMKMLRQLPRLLKFIPGAAQDVRAYFLSLQYWLAGSEENVANLVRHLVTRYAAGDRAALKGALAVAPPQEYPDVGVYHPRLKDRVASDIKVLPAKRAGQATVGLLIMRSYVLSGDAGHYDGVIAALEARGLRVIPAFASGLDAREAVERFFVGKNGPTVDAVVSLTGFSLVGGPAYNDTSAATALLESLDVPYVAAHALEFQSISEWRAGTRGLTPVEATMMIAIPELDGATGPIVFGGRDMDQGGRAMRADADRVAMLAARVDRLIRLRKKPASERKISIVLFNFPPNSGAVGSAAHLAVFESLFNVLKGLAGAGYRVDMPKDVDDLRTRILNGNAERFGTDANVAARMRTDEHVRRERRLAEIEKQWGPAPGRHLTDGQSLFVLGAEFGNVLVGVQPGFGIEGDPMRLLFDRGFAPTHAFAAFYRHLRENFDADAILHFGTHGALEFMPGKQTGLSGACWPDYLIGDVPNFYFYAANNPSEAAIAKRRSAATTISYLTPSVCEAGLYRGLADLKASLNRWRSLEPEQRGDAGDLVALIQAEAAALELAPAAPPFTDACSALDALHAKLLAYEETLIPNGLHVAGAAPSRAERIDILSSMAKAANDGAVSPSAIEAIVDGASPESAAEQGAGEQDRAALHRLARVDALLRVDHEIPAILRALDGRFISPAPGGDLLVNDAVLPTGRNVHGFDPFRLPSAFAVADGRRQAEKLLARHAADGLPTPESVAIVLWGADNLKNEGAPLAQAMALLGAEPRFDSYGRLCGARLIPLEALGRPRIDVIATLSGIFRDLLPFQTRMLAEAAFAAASADEPEAMNFVRKHALAHMRAHGCDLETAALRVFSNAEGAYGANVNQMIDSGVWNEEDELAEAYTRRKCFAYGRSGAAAPQAALLNSILANVDVAYQNLESVELGVTTIDHYFDTLGGIGRAVRRAKGSDARVYIGDQTRGDGVVRTLAEQVDLETRTRTLNPKWYEGMLKHGYEGVRSIEAHVTNTVGWSATTGQVAPWIYQKITETFVLDPALRERLIALNPKSCAKVASRLLEASDRKYWTPDSATLEALRRAGEDIEDRLEGVAA